MVKKEMNGRMVNMKIKKLTETAVVPTKGTPDAAGLDLYSDIYKMHSEKKSPAPDECWIGPGETVMVSTGISMEIPQGYCGLIYARSGLATKRGLRPANCVGVIDSDYRGEIIVALHNDSSEPQMIEHNERIAQMVITPYLSVTIEESIDLSDTERGSGGFGSTGTK